MIRAFFTVTERKRGLGEKWVVRVMTKYPFPALHRRTG